MYKICSKCKEEKLFEQFNKHVRKVDGYNSQCKSCVRERKQANKEKYALQRKIYECLNKDKISEYIKKYRELNADRISIKMKEYQLANREKISEYQKEYDKVYYELNREKIANYQKLYQQLNKPKVNARNAKRKARKLEATPNWLTKEELAQIVEFYEIAQAFKLYTGKEYHVDHIVPLQGENVCGLHVPWNLQVITAEENLRKSNKYE